MTLPEYLKQHYTPDTAKAYRREIEIYQSNLKEADKAVYKDILHYIGLLRQRYNKAATLSRIISSIKVYYDYLCSEEIRNDNPARSIQLKDKRSKDIQLQDLFTTEELEALLNRKERYGNLECRNKVLMSLIIYQAMHPQAMEALAIGDINLTTGSIYIKPTAKTNGRTLQLKPNQVLLFYEYINDIRLKLLKESPSNALLIGLRGESMKAEDITKHVKRSFNVFKATLGDIVNCQVILVREYKKALSKFRRDNNFNPNELNYLGRVYDNLFKQSLQNLDELTNVITANKLRMSDDERLKTIDNIYDEMQDKLMFLRHFNNNTTILAIQRARKKNDVTAMRSIYGLNN